MNDRGSRSPECEQYADQLAELALGILTGRERAQALAHVEGCPVCPAELEQLSLAADLLLEVTPSVEPPLGFEVRLMERLGTGRANRRRFHRQWRLRPSTFVLTCVVAALLVATVGVGVGTGWLSGSSPHPVVAGFGTDAGGHLQTETLVAGSRTIGEVTVYSGKTSWLFMSVDDGSWSGNATCEIRFADGSTLPLGTFWLEKGYGAWAAPFPSGMGPIANASLVTGGTVLASASFHA
jgi:hypothetical protein